MKTKQKKRRHKTARMLLNLAAGDRHVTAWYWVREDGSKKGEEEELIQQETFHEKAYFSYACLERFRMKVYSFSLSKR